MADDPIQSVPASQPASGTDKDEVSIAFARGYRLGRKSVKRKKVVTGPNIQPEVVPTVNVDHGETFYKRLMKGLHG